MLEPYIAYVHVKDALMADGEVVVAGEGDGHVAEIFGLLEKKQFQGFLKKFRNLVKQADVIAMSGSVPKGLDGSAYQRLVEICREEKRNVILDTSGALLTMGIEAKPTMIKPNLDEIRMLTGMSYDSLEEMIEAAKQIHEGGVEIVAVSLGAEGSFVVCEEGIYQAQVPKIDAVNTVGCGDSMIAGFAVGMSQKISVEGSLRLASAISAAAALREETGFFVKEDIGTTFLKKVKINKVNKIKKARDKTWQK